METVHLNVLKRESVRVPVKKMYFLTSTEAFLYVNLRCIVELPELLGYNISSKYILFVAST